MSILFSGSYSQSFDSLAAAGNGNAWTNDLSLLGWHLFRQPVASPVAITTYNADTGASFSGAFVSYGASGDSDRALGGLGSGGSYFGSPPSGAVAGWFALALNNTSGSAISSLNVSFNGEQWRNGGNATAQTMVLEYGYGASFDQVTSWVAPGGNFNWTSPVATTAAAAVDGNTAGRVTGRGGSLDLSVTPWAAGSTLWLRWIETNDSGNDHGVAIDDLAISLPQPVVQPELAIQAIDAVAAEYGDGASIRISRTGSTAAELVVPISLVAGAGLATAADLSAPFPASLTIPAGAASVDLAISLLDDSLDEGTETLRIEITAPAGTTLAASGARVDLTLFDNDRISLISAVQGTGATSPLVGQSVTLRAVVVGDFQLSSELGGFFLQEEIADWDTSALSSEGLYVAYPLSGSNVNVALGDRVLLSGLVGERFGQTSITSVGSLSVEAQGRLSDTRRLDIPDLLAQRSASLDLEPYEGMWVRFPETLSVNGLYGQFRFGEIELSAGGLPQQPTNVMPPGAAAYAAEQATARRELVLDDGSNSSYRPASAATAAAPVRDQLLRRGDMLTAVEGILAYDFSKYRLHPTAPLSFLSENPRPAAPAAPAAGQIRLASFNVLNTFTTLNAGGALTDSGLAPRGANSAEELERQLSKLTAALVGLKADVIGLMELENDADDATLATIVQRLNAAQPTGSGRSYSFVPTGLIGTDAIKVGLIYNNLAVAPNGAAQVLNSQAFTDPLASGTAKNRPALAQTFRELASGETLNVVVNHLKSKGATDATGADLDQLDGQAAYNATRTAAATRLLEWIQSDPTGSGDPDWVVLGDINAYAKEDPIRVFEAAGYRNALPTFTAEPPSSYAFFNPVDMSGALDHMLISPSLVPQATTALDWSINAAEGAFRDYNLDSNSNGNATARDFFAADPYRTSDHDPLLLDLDLGRAVPAGLAFAHGVASGDPYADSVILWTRITPPASFAGLVDVQWEIATRADFAAGSIKGSGSFSTSAARDWTVKVEAAGLSADTTYFYRFSSGTTASGVGQTKTLPVNSDPVRLAVFSCSNFTAAQQFDAYARAAAINSANPYDAWLHLGDYIYEYGPGGYGSAEDAAGSRGFLPNREILSLDDYRQRYAQYHTDAGLQALRAAAPLIAGWDDHETANNSWSNGAQNHQSPSEGDWIARRDAALKAYYEWIPIREPGQRQASDGASALSPLTQAYRSFNFGDVLSLHMLETRLTARDQQLPFPPDPAFTAAVQARIGSILADPALVASYATKAGVAQPTTPATFAAFGAALAPLVTQELVVATVQQAWGDPSRDMIGDSQLAWLQQRLASSTAAWQVLGQQTLMQSMAVPAELLLNVGNLALLDKYAAPLQKLATGTLFADLTPAEQALFAEAGKIPYNLDAWDGYGVERETILQTAQALGKRLISLAGDTHNAWAGVLDTMSSGSLAGVEFATPGVTSPGLERILPGADAYIRGKYPAVDGLDGLFVGYVKGLQYADLNRRGFLDLTVTLEDVIGSFVFLDGVNPSTGMPQSTTETVLASEDFTLITLLNAQESEWFGVSDVFLNGNRNPGVRSEETNLGNLTADANLAYARSIDPTVLVSLKNGGGIRNSIGQSLVPTGSVDGKPDLLPTAAVFDALGNVVKPEGGISRNDIANALSFNNGLSLVTVTHAELKALLEYGLAAGINQGRFPQVGGLAFSYDLSRPAGERIVNLAVKDDNGNDLAVVVRNGRLIGDPNRTIRMVTLDFLASGGDGYPFSTLSSPNRVDITEPSAPRTGIATFAANGSEQDALAEYLSAVYPQSNPFISADSDQASDTRLQNLAARTDSVINPIAGPTILKVGGADNLISAAVNDRTIVGQASLRQSVDILIDDTIIGTAKGNRSNRFTYTFTDSQLQQLNGQSAEVVVRPSNAPAGTGQSQPFSFRVDTTTATSEQDRLIGNPESTTFRFANFNGGVPKGGIANYDMITNYKAGDMIDFQSVTPVTIGASAGSSSITSLQGTASALTAAAINAALGNGFRGKGATGAFSVAGLDGSFLAVNNRGKGFDSGDTLVFLEGYTPSVGSPVNLI
jgi:predicted extracellular nuclease/phosphodiesterase/alkaline phosphatase D-like protein